MNIVHGNEATLSVYSEKPIVLATAWVLWGFPYNHLSNNSIECNSVLLLEASFDNKKWPVETQFPPLLGVPTKIIFIDYKKFPLHYIST